MSQPLLPVGREEGRKKRTHKSRKKGKAQAEDDTQTTVESENPLAAPPEEDPEDPRPKAFFCPITLEPMEDPVIAADGISYERVDIQSWLETKDTSPLTGETLAHKNLIPNIALRQSIEEWLEGVQGRALARVEAAKRKEDIQRELAEESVRDALSDLFNATSGRSNWENVDGWEEEDEEDIQNKWGITVSSTAGEIVRIKLKDNGLEGMLVESLTHVTSLVVLDCSNNFLEGSVPGWLHGFPALQKLDLSANRLTGQLDSHDLSRCTGMIKLDLRNNMLTGPVPKSIVQMDRLRHLDVSQNDLTGWIPEELGYMDTLRVLNLNDNTLDGEVPDSFTLLTNLNRLHLEFNNFDSDPHWLVEYLAEDCDFEADEAGICTCEISMNRSRRRKRAGEWVASTEGGSCVLA